MDTAASAEQTAAAQPGVALRPRRSTPRPSESATRGRERSRFYRWTHPRFAIDIIDELRKVVWPSRTETRNLTTVVVIVATAVAIILGTVDWAFNRVMENILLP